MERTSSSGLTIHHCRKPHDLASSRASSTSAQAISYRPASLKCSPRRFFASLSLLTGITPASIGARVVSRPHERERRPEALETPLRGDRGHRDLLWLHGLRGGLS